MLQFLLVVIDSNAANAQQENALQITVRQEITACNDHAT